MYRDFEGGEGAVAEGVPQPSWSLLSEMYLSVMSRHPAVFPSNIPCSSLMSQSPLVTTLNCRAQAKEKCIVNAQQLGCLLDMLHSLSTGAELINVWTASQICVFPCAGSNVSGLLCICFIVPLPSFLSLKSSHTGLRKPIICSLPFSHACPNLSLDWTMTSSEKYFQSIIQQIEKERSDYTHWLKIY